MSGFLVDSPNAQRAVDEGGRVRDVPRPNFVFYYHPAEWQMNVEGEIVPSIGHFSLAPGSGADSNGDFSQRHAELVSKGFVRIAHDVLGAAMPDYVARYTNHRGKAVHRTIFQIPHTGADRVTRWRDDPEAIRAFLGYLRRKGLIQRPRPEVIEGMLRDAERALIRLADVEPARNAIALRRHDWKIARAQRAIETLQAELAESIETYGRPEAPVRSKLLELLQADEPDTAAAEAVVREVRKRGPRKGKTEPLPDLPPDPAAPESGGFNVADHEEDE